MSTKHLIDDRGIIFVWTAELAKRNNMRTYDGELEKSKIQSHLTTQQKVDNDIPLNELEKEEYPNLWLEQQNRIKEKEAALGVQSEIKEVVEEKTETMGDDTEGTQDVLSSMNLDQLKDIAVSKGVDFHHALKNEDKLREMIRAKQNEAA